MHKLWKSKNNCSKVELKLKNKFKNKKKAINIQLDNLKAKNQNEIKTLNVQIDN